MDKGLGAFTQIIAAIAVLELARVPVRDVRVDSRWRLEIGDWTPLLSDDIALEKSTDWLTGSPARRMGGGSAARCT